MVRTIFCTQYLTLCSICGLKGPFLCCTFLCSYVNIYVNICLHHPQQLVPGMQHFQCKKHASHISLLNVAPLTLTLCPLVFNISTMEKGPDCLSLPLIIFINFAFRSPFCLQRYRENNQGLANLFLELKRC